MNKSWLTSLKPQSLSAWITLSIGMFTVIGSLCLIGFFQYLSYVEEIADIESLGRTNARFLEQSGLPQSQRLSTQLGRVMGARVSFQNPTQTQSIPLSPNGKATKRKEWIFVGFSLNNGQEVWFSRKFHFLGSKPVWKRTDAIVALPLFWLFSFAFALWLAHKVSRPITKLEALIPLIGTDSTLTTLPASGPSEILNLAQALHKTHHSLLDEREKRRHAERLALLGKMASCLAHEVRNPIAAIHLHAQLLERSCSEMDTDSAKLIVTEANRIESMVSQWLHFAKPQPVTRNPIDLALLIQEATRILSPQASHANAQIHIHTQANWNESPVLGDANRIKQVLCNLILNAIQSMPHGGNIHITLSARHILIEDEGGGFSPSALSAFAQPFQSEKEGGMGLGLAVSKEILDAHGASLHARNRSPHGAELEIIWHQHA